MGHTRLKADARAQRHLLEDQAKNLAFEEFRTTSRFEIGLNLFSGFENRFEFFRRKIGECENVSQRLHVRLPFVKPPR